MIHNLKSTLQSVLSQVQKKREIQPFPAVAPNRAIRRDDVLKRISDYFQGQRTDSKRKIYYFLVRLHVIHGFVFPRQAVIGEFADINREQVNRHLVDMEKAGLLIKRNRGYQTCMYLLPKELNSMKFLQKLTGLFPWLKTLPILMLSMMGNGSGTTKRTPISQERLKLLNIYKYTLVRGVLFQDIGDTYIKRKIVTQIISLTNQNISANLSLTEYAMLLNTAFDDETLQIAYDLTSKNKNKAKNVYAYFFGLCRRISEKMNKKPNYVGMYSLVTAAGYGPGARTMIQADEEAQPRYEKFIEKVSDDSLPQLSDKATYWLKSFNSEKVLDKIKQ